MRRYHLLFLTTLLWHFANADDAEFQTMSNELDTVQIIQLLDSAFTLSLDHAEPLINQAFKRSEKLGFTNGIFESQYKLARLMARSGDFNRAIATLNEAQTSFELTLSQQSIYSNFIGICFVYMGQYDSTEKYFQKTLETKTVLNDSVGMGTLLNNLGNVNLSKGDLEQSTSYYLDALRVRTAINDSAGIASTTNNLGIAFYKREMFREAIQNYLIALEINRVFADASKEALILNNLGNSYDEIEVYDTSYFYYSQAIQIADSLADARLIGISSSNLGVAELRRENFKAAEALFLRSLEVRQASNDKQGEAEILNELASLKVMTNDLRSAERYFLSSLTIAQEIASLEIIREDYLGLSDVHSKLGNFEKAFANHTEYVVFKDSILNQENQQSLNELVTKYDTEKKEQQIALQESQLSEQRAQLGRNRLLTITLIVAVISVIALWLLNRSRLRKKQQLQLQQEKLHIKEAEINATISSQEKERARYARDLHDGFGQMISILNMNISSLRKGADPQERQTVFEESEKVIDEMYDELKGICFDLMPQTLVQNGLQSGLEEFAERINRANKVFIETNFFGLDQRLVDIQEISLYRITQEWINNILKYSDAQKITLQITRDDAEVTLLIEDDGTGFDPALLKQSDGNGWKNLNTRTNLLQGKLELETKEGARGTTLIVNAPYMLSKASQSQENTGITV